MPRKAKKQVVKMRWLRWTEASNALDYLKRAQQFIGQVDDDKTAWKWVVISLYGALYGFMVCALTGGNPNKVTFPKTVGKKPNQKTIRQLISFSEALRRCQQSSPKLIWMSRSHLTITANQNKSIQVLQEDFRHQFEHYQPMGWSIWIHEMPGICLDAVEVLRSLILDTNILHNFNLTENERNKLRSCLKQCPRLLKKSRVYRELDTIITGKAKWYIRKPRGEAQRAFNAVLADFEKLASENAPAGPTS